MSQTIEIKVPDIGDFSGIPVIEIAVKVGDTVAIDDTLVTLESDKATMDVPSSAAGIIKEIRVKLGDRVSQGSIVAIVEAASVEAPVKAAPTPAATVVPPAPLTASAPPAAVAASSPSPMPQAAPATPISGHAHASPSVRLFARELGVDLTKVTASGPKGRILREDVTAFVKGVMVEPSLAKAASGMPVIPTRSAPSRSRRVISAAVSSRGPCVVA